MNVAGRWRTVVPSHLPRPIWVLAAGQVVDSFGSGLVFPLTTLYVVHVLGRDLTWAGTVLSLHSLLATVMVGIGGRLADRLGRKPLLLTSLVSSGVVSFLIGLWPVATAYAVLMVLFGMTVSLYRPASQALVSDLAPGRERQVFSLLYMALNLGVALGAAAGGSLVAAWSYRAIYWADALTFFLSAVLVAWGVPDTFRKRLLTRRRHGAALPGTGNAAGNSPVTSLGEQRRTTGRTAPTGGPERVREPATAPAFGAVGQRGPRSRRLDDLYQSGLLSVVILGLASLGLWFVYAQLQTVLPVTMSGLGFSEAAYGMLWSLNAILVVVLTPVLSTLADRRGWSLSGLLQSSAVVHAAGFAILLLAGDRPVYGWFVLAIVVITVGEVLQAISFSATVARIAPEDLRGTYQGLAGMLTSLGWVAGPLLGGAIADAWGTTALWAVTVVVPLCALLGYRMADAVGTTRSGAPRHASMKA
ncbi:MAG: MFS transporter [Bacillota bacterium]|nr:MAG: MFS transporter [Bacillota bacterium]